MDGGMCVMEGIYSNPLISVIVPIYRVEAYLDECIQSIRNQTYQNLEIILIDDGSDDMCPQICDRHANEDERVKVVHKKNGGLDSARKAGMLIATGKYVGYVDADDWIEPEMYEQLLMYAQRYQVDVVELGFFDSYKNKEEERLPYLEEGCYKGADFIEKVEPKLLYADVFYEYSILPFLWNKLFLKERVVKYQMKDGLTNTIFDDVMVSLPCIAKTKSIYILHKCYYHYRVRRDSLKKTYRFEAGENLIQCYTDFYARFKGTQLCSENDKQIKYYAMYWLLFNAPHIFDCHCDDDFLVPFGNIKIASKIVLYGAGAAGIHWENYIRNVKKGNIVCWADKNYKNLQEDLDVINPKEILRVEYDYVVIAIMKAKAAESARKDLAEMGVPEEKILWIKQEYIDEPEKLLSKIGL